VEVSSREGPLEPKPTGMEARNISTFAPNCTYYTQIIPVLVETMTFAVSASCAEDDFVSVNTEYVWTESGPNDNPRLLLTMSASVAAGANDEGPTLSTECSPSWLMVDEVAAAAEAKRFWLLRVASTNTSR